MTPATTAANPATDVLIRCHNSAPHIGEAVRSALDQPDVDVHVLVMDDASSDGTADRVRALNDGRVTLVENPSLRGEAGCLNALLDRARSPYVVVTPADAILLPGALGRLVVTLERSPRTGQVYGGAFPVDSDGRVARQTVRDLARRHAERAARHGGVGYLRAVGEEAVGPIAYRRVVLEEVGRFTEGRAGRARLQATGRIARRYDVQVVPELLCARRPDTSRRTSRQRVTWATARARISVWVRGLRRHLVWGLVVPFRDRLYDYALSHFSEWPIGLIHRKRAVHDAPKRIAYFLWRYPVHSQTFIQRELTTLEQAGLDVLVIAEGAETPVQRVEYLDQPRPGLLLRDLAGFALRRPFRTANLLAYVLFRTYRPPKSMTEDVRLFLRAIRLASILRDRRIDHVHAPWGDLNAFIAMVAARLAGAQFSVQFRAHDLHRRTAAFLLPEKIRQAAFVVTNSIFNERRLQSLALPGDRHKIRRIYNGLDLDRFDSRPRPVTPRAEARILSVARMIEAKGLVYLLEACRALRESGYRFRCEIVGGPELPLYVNDYLQIKLQYERLDLGDCVEFLGTQPFSRVLECYRNADLFVLPCVVARDGSNDITPNSLLEAMAMRLPVVSTRITAIPEIVEDGVSGILVPPNDAAALRDQMARLIDDPDLGRTLGENARRRIEDRFDIRKNVRSYLELFGAS
jgi:glycosyltransferase involved in cell wall biosynthesis